MEKNPFIIVVLDHNDYNWYIKKIVIRFAFTKILAMAQEKAELQQDYYTYAPRHIEQNGIKVAEYPGLTYLPFVYKSAENMEELEEIKKGLPMFRWESLKEETPITHLLFNELIEKMKEYGSPVFYIKHLGVSYKEDRNKVAEYMDKNFDPYSIDFKDLVKIVEKYYKHISTIPAINKLIEEIKDPEKAKATSKTRRLFGIADKIMRLFK